MSTDVVDRAEPQPVPASTVTSDMATNGTVINGTASNGTAPADQPDKLLPLWRNWRFQLLWIGSGTASLGISAADVAYPLIIIAMTGSPAMAALFAAVQLTAGLLAGLPAGSLVDRFDRRRMLLVAEASRMLVTASVVVAWLMGDLTIIHLMIVSAILGAVQPFGGAARMLVVRAVVPKQQLTQALTQEEVRSAVTGLAGPPLGGVLYALSRALPFLLTAAAFATSFLCALVVRIPARAATTTTASGTAASRTAASRTPAGNPTADQGGMFQGIRALWANKTIRAALTMISVINIGGSVLFLSVVVLLQSPRAVGIGVAGEAAGSLIGAGLVGHLHRRVAPGKLLIGVAALFAPMTALLAVPLGPWWVFGVLACSVLGVPALRVLIDVLILRQVPDEQRGRTITALMTMLTIGVPIGTLVGGLLLQSVGPTVTILCIAGLNVLALIRGACDRNLRTAQWPAAAA